MSRSVQQLFDSPAEDHPLAVIKLTRALAGERGRHGITVNP